MKYDNLTPEQERLARLVVNPMMKDLPGERNAPWEIAHDRYQTALMHDKRGKVMTNDDHEIRDAARFASTASGCVLVLGLGLGMVIRMLLARDEVTCIAVVEIDQKVIDLVGDSVTHDRRVTIRQGDALSAGTVKKHRRRYPNASAVWADIWDSADANSYDSRMGLIAKWQEVAPDIKCWGMDRSQINWLRRLDRVRKPH